MIKIRFKRIFLVALVSLVVGFGITSAENGVSVNSLKDLNRVSKGYNRPSAMPKDSLAFGGKAFEGIKTQGSHSSKIFLFICAIQSDYLKHTIKTHRLYAPPQVFAFINAYSFSKLTNVNQ